MPVMLALTEGQVQVGFVSGHSLRPELNCIFSVQVCLSQVRYVAVQLALNSFLVSDHEQFPVNVAACNLFARKLNFFARAALPLLSIIAAVSAVAGATGSPSVSPRVTEVPVLV